MRQNKWVGRVGIGGGMTLLFFASGRSGILLLASLYRMGSRQHGQDPKHGLPLSYRDDVSAYTREYAEALDSQDPLRLFRDEFIIPTKKDLKRKVLARDEGIFLVAFAD